VLEKQHKAWFSSQLLDWHEHQNHRKMPWKGEKDPYKIWLSEVILQQTRVEQGWDYYTRFIKAYPTVQDLAEAPDNEVFKYWEGLGYYSRCRNLIHTARVVAADLNGQFPNTYEGLLSLKGVGPYTASAIGSFAFGLPTAVVDGNVIRVLSRCWGIEEPVDRTDTRAQIDLLAQQLIDQKQPAAYNQAMMDLGATVCKPQQPVCEACPFAKKCFAKKNQLQDALPKKQPKKKARDRWFHYLVMESGSSQLVRQRQTKDIWQDLYEFILMETDEPADEKTIKTSSFWGMPKTYLGEGPFIVSDEMIHQLSHQKIYCRFVYVRLDKKISVEGYSWVGKQQRAALAFPRLITRYLEMQEIR